MKKKLLLAICLASLCLNAAPAMADPFGADGGARLQSVLDNITKGPNPGDSSVDVTTDMLPDDKAAGSPYDSYWSITGTGGSFATLVFKVTESGYETLGDFGIYDYADPTKTVQLFEGDSVTPGSQATVTIKTDGSVYTLGGTHDTGIDFGGNLFGYYFDTENLCAAGGGFWHSDSALNGGQDHMYAYQGTNTDTVQLPGLAPGTWTPNEYILAWECGNLSSADKDYDDLVVMVESVEPIPVPGAVLLGLLGLTAAGVKLRRFA